MVPEHEWQLAIVVGSARPGQLLGGGDVPASSVGGGFPLFGPHTVLASFTHADTWSPEMVEMGMHVKPLLQSLDVLHVAAQYESPPSCPQTPPRQSVSMRHAVQEALAAELSGLKTPESLPLLSSPENADCAQPPTTEMPLKATVANTKR